MLNYVDIKEFLSWSKRIQSREVLEIMNYSFIVDLDFLNKTFHKLHSHTRSPSLIPLTIHAMSLSVINCYFKLHVFDDSSNFLPSLEQ